MESKNDNVQEETNAVSGTTVMSVRNRQQKQIHRLNHQHKRGGRASRIKKAGVHLGSSLDSRAKITWKVFAPDHLADFWPLPECQFFESWAVCKFGDKCSVAHKQAGWRSTQQKTDKKCSGYIERCTTVVLPISGHSRLNLHRFYGRAQKSWDQFDECDSRKLRSVLQTSEKAKVRRSEKCKSKVRHQRSFYAVKSEDRSQEETERHERCACGDAWKLDKNISQLFETEEATFLRFSMSGFCPPYPQ